MKNKLSVYLQITETFSYLETVKTTIPQINTNPYPVPWIIVFEIRKIFF